MQVLRTAALAGLTAWLGAAGPAAAPPGGAAPADAATQACTARAVEKIQHRYESVRDLSADFVQTTRSVALGAAGASTASRGSVVFAKPGKMRWQYDAPEPSLVVSDGKWLWIFDPAHRRCRNSPSARDSSRAPRSSSCSERARSSAISR
jgi:outer membrane lipoprotein carrier protein